MGFTCHAGDLSWDDLIAYAREGERLGYDAFCLTEESGKEAFATLAVLARSTTRVNLATTIVNFYSRTPTLLAMGARSIHGLSGGRFRPFGLGTGGIGFMERGHGIKIERPLARARETVAIVRGLLSSPHFSYDGQWFHVRDFHLREGRIEGEIPIWLAGLGPKMVGAAAQVADGVIANWLTEESLAEYLGIIDQAASAVGRDPRAFQVATLLMMGADPDDEEAMLATRRGLAFYCASNHYLHIADISGYGEQARRVKAAWETKDFEGATRLVTEDMVHKFSLTGTDDECEKRLRWLLENGVYPVIYPLPRRSRMRDDHLDTIRRAARLAGLTGASA
jgi:alkanesulfonate monooxygenase SsuD/methylene tetrahydromethanopterin reductase-like flavin-dependent oxidoreductase (luciferase family)